MTHEEYGRAYTSGFNLTIRFLISKGLSFDTAQETAQAAWVKGWERLGQLRNPSMILTWVNSIALNIHRSYIRQAPLEKTTPELSTPPNLNLAAIDVGRVLARCRNSERMVLDWHYIQGYRVQEIANKQGCTETAVRLRLLRARRTVAKKIGRKFAAAPGRAKAEGSRAG